MITNQLMKRDFFDVKIRQRTSDSYFSATDLMKAYNISRDTDREMKGFWRNDSTSRFMSELAEDLNRENSPHLKTTLESDLYDTRRGRQNGGTWMHPYLFVKFAMWLSPEFEVKVIKWVYDNLIDFRNQAGENYKEMSMAIRDTYESYYEKSPSPLIYKSEARYLNELVKGRHLTGERNDFSENELSLLNDLQKLNISMLKNMTPGKKRKNALRDYSDMYKIAKF